MLAMTRRPSATTPGSVAKLAVEQHDLRDGARRRRAVAHGDADVGVLQRERVVDAVAGHRDDVAPRLQRADHRPLLVRRDPAEHGRCSSTSASASLVFGQLARVDRRRPPPSSPTRPATAPTVRGLSPEMTFTATPCSREVRERVGGVGSDLLLEQRRARRPRGRRAAPRRRARRRARASSSTRCPRPASSSARRRTGSSAAGRAQTISGAPSTHVPWPSNAAALHLRADENGTTRARPARPARRTRSRDRVAASRCGSSSAASAPSASAIAGRRRRRAARPSSNAIVALGERAGLVEAARRRRGPGLRPRQLLDEHVAGGRAVTAAIAKAMLVSSTRPSGTIATTPATDA